VGALIGGVRNRRQRLGFRGKSGLGGWAAGFGEDGDGAVGGCLDGLEIGADGIGAVQAVEESFEGAVDDGELIAEIVKGAARGGVGSGRGGKEMLLGAAQCPMKNDGEGCEADDDDEGGGQKPARGPRGVEGGGNGPREERAEDGEPRGGVEAASGAGWAGGRRRKSKQAQHGV